MDDAKYQRGTNNFFTRTNSAANGTPSPRPQGRQGEPGAPGQGAGMPQGAPNGGQMPPQGMQGGPGAGMPQGGPQPQAPQGAGAQPAAEHDPYDVAQQEKGYPEPSSHGILPSYGLFISHAKNVTVDHVQFETIEEDKRPVIVLMDVDDVKFSDMKVDKSAEAPYFVLKGVRNFEVKDFTGLKNQTIKEAANKSL